MMYLSIFTLHLLTTSELEIRYEICTYLPTIVVLTMNLFKFFFALCHYDRSLRRSVPGDELTPQNQINCTISSSLQAEAPLSSRADRQASLIIYSTGSSLSTPRRRHAHRLVGRVEINNAEFIDWRCTDVCHWTWSLSPDCCCCCEAS